MLLAYGQPTQRLEYRLVGDDVVISNIEPPDERPNHRKCPWAGRRTGQGDGNGMAPMVPAVQPSM